MQSSFHVHARVVRSEKCKVITWFPLKVLTIWTAFVVSLPLVNSDVHVGLLL